MSYHPSSLASLLGIPFSQNLTIHPGHWLKITRPDSSIVRVTFTIGLLNAHGLSKQVLNWHNCYSFGNGVESNRITDNFNTQHLTPGAKVSTVFEDYKEEHRKYGLIYSGLYNSIGNVNNLNQFIQAEKITKDINPTYGSIQKLHARDTDLVTLCEDKVLKILASKDALYNADGNPQLVATDRVLGQAVPFVGEFGISKNPESFVSEAYRSYFTDKQRGAVMRLSRDGLTPISMHGMKDWFRDNLKLSNKLIGSYDDRNDEYNITLDNTTTVPTTVSFREDVTGWVSFKSFVPENAISCANDYFTISDGKLYKHYVEVLDAANEDVNRNIFYGMQVNSSINVILNESPGSVKSFHTLDYEGSQSRVEGVRTVEVTGIQHNNTTVDGQYFFFEKEDMGDVINEDNLTQWDGEKFDMKQYRNNILVFDGSVKLMNTGHSSSSSTSGGLTKGHGRRDPYDAANPGDFQVGDIITTELQEKSVSHFNSAAKDGWHVSNITTDKQRGSLSEFVDKGVDFPDLDFSTLCSSGVPNCHQF